jgi:hypothetical protein
VIDCCFAEGYPVIVSLNVRSYHTTCLSRLGLLHLIYLWVPLVEHVEFYFVYFLFGGLIWLKSWRCWPLILYFSASIVHWRFEAEMCITLVLTSAQFNLYCSKVLSFLFFCLLAESTFGALKYFSILNNFCGDLA